MILLEVDLLEEDASAGDSDEFPLKTTILLSSDVLMARFL